MSLVHADMVCIVLPLSQVCDAGAVWGLVLLQRRCAETRRMSLQGPTDGTIVFTDGTGAVLAQGPATPCGNGQIGLTVAFSSQGGAYGIGYGQHSGESPPLPPSLHSTYPQNCLALSGKPLLALPDEGTAWYGSIAALNRAPSV